MSTGLFIGLTTLDVIYLTEQVPEPNQKVVALDYAVAAGGPVTNAAVAFAHLGNTVTLVTVLGQHPIARLIHQDLQACGVTIADLMPNRLDPPTISSILVNQATGERAVVARNAVDRQARPDQLPNPDLSGIDIILIDGHQMAVSQAICQGADGIPIVIDAGSWKPGFEAVLPYADYVICSANFRPPGCQTSDDVFAYLHKLAVPYTAVTNGADPIQFSTNELSGSIPVPAVTVVDTLAAGDIFHGAFCHYILRADFITALQKAATIASAACTSFGTRQWLLTPTIA